MHGLLKLNYPKKYVLIYDRTEADSEELQRGYQQGLDDETRQLATAKNKTQIR